MRQVFFTPDAVRQLKRLPGAARPLVRNAITLHLANEDPTVETRNRFRLRRLSEHADYELRAGEWRVFYRVSSNRVIITLIGEKRGNRLIVEGEGIQL